MDHPGDLQTENLEGSEVYGTLLVVRSKNGQVGEHLKRDKSAAMWRICNMLSCHMPMNGTSIGVGQSVGNGSMDSPFLSGMEGDGRCPPLFPIVMASTDQNRMPMPPVMKKPSLSSRLVVPSSPSKSVKPALASSEMLEPRL